VAPTAVLCGNVHIGPECRVLFGAVLTAEGGPIRLGSTSIVMENAVIRASARHPVEIGKHVLIGPHSYLSGCIVEDHAFLATGCSIFNGAHVGRGAEVRINGIVHIRTSLLPDSVVPIGWVAVGDPAEILPTDAHERIWSTLKPLDFPRTVFGLDRAASSMIMPELTARYARALGNHREDSVRQDVIDHEACF
jgi:carbonic anhydrase/acetyltransferase-like protein (isoleucine patch superfamily)